MKHEHFTDERIDEIRSGRSVLTAEEREFLVSNTPCYEECTYTQEELTAMSDEALMGAVYRVWSDYHRGMF